MSYQIFTTPPTRLAKLAPKIAELAKTLSCHVSKYMAKCPEMKKATKMASEKPSFLSSFSMSTMFPAWINSHSFIYHCCTKNDCLLDTNYHIACIAGFWIGQLQTATIKLFAHEKLIF